MVYIKRSKDKQWYFIVKATNGKTLVQSETYRRKANCIKGIDALKAAMKPKYEFENMEG